MILVVYSILSRDELFKRLENDDDNLESFSSLKELQEEYGEDVDITQVFLFHFEDFEMN